MDNDPPGTTKDAEESLCQAYRLGRYQMEYVFLLYDYRKDKWDTTIFSWDAISHLTYMLSWWANFPSKYLRKLAYLIDQSHYGLIIDHAIQLPVLLMEGAIGAMYNGIGLVLGLFLHPVDTLNAVLGGIWLIAKSIFGGIVDLGLTLFLLAKSAF